MKKTKIKGCASLALALALVVPTTAKAASTVEIQTGQTTLESTANAKKEENISSQVQMNLDETGKVATYTINVEKTNNTDDLKAIFYISDESNLANLEVISDDNISQDQVKVEDSLDGKKISIDLKQASTINLKADIKDGKENKLVFDYILANDSETALTSKRVISSISKDQDGKASLKEQEVAGLGSILGGKFVDNSTIQWSDFLVNQSPGDILTNYAISLSDGQTKPENLHIEIYRASKEGFVSEASHDLDFGDIKDLTIPAGGAAKISFKTKADESVDTFTANGVELKREKSTEDAKDNQVESLTEQINENDAKIKEEIKKSDHPSEEKTTSNENSKVENLTKDIDKKDEEIKEAIKEADKNQENEDSPAEKEVKIVVLKDEAPANPVEDLPIKENLSQAEVDSLITDLDNRTIKIQKTMQEIDKEYGESLAKTTISAESKSPNNETIADIIKDLDDRNKAIQDELEKIYGKYAVDTVMDLNKSIDDETYELITGVDKNNETIKEIIDQVNLSIETKKALEDEKELANVKALLDNVEELAENNEKALDKVEEEDKKQENTQNFKKVVPGYSEKVYNDLEKVVTVTLDPLKTPTQRVDKETATKSYPTIAKYLEELAAIKDSLK